MPLRRNNTRRFTRKTFAGQTEKVRILKRGDDQAQGTVTSFILYRCRRSQIMKTGETIQGDMVSDHECVWHIPRTEMERVGINHLNSLDRIQQLQGREKDFWWQPEATTPIDVKMFANEIDLHCLRVDPPVLRQ